jgi:CRISPR-associated protein Cas2
MKQYTGFILHAWIMQCVVVYDIPDDGKRTKIADACLDYGLDRIQYSAFMGNLQPTHQDELMLRIQKVLGKHAGNVQLFPLCEKDWAARRVIVVEAQEEDAG